MGVHNGPEYAYGPIEARSRLEASSDHWAETDASPGMGRLAYTSLPDGGLKARDVIRPPAVSGNASRARHRRATTMRVVIAYDGSDYAKAAVDDLRRSGMPGEAEVLVISVGEPVLPPVQAPSADIAHLGASRRVASTLVQATAQTSHAMEEARALAQEGSERVHARFPDWVLSAEALVGTPAPVIMQKAEDWQAPL